MLEFSQRNGTFDSGDTPQWESILTSNDVIEDETVRQIIHCVDSTENDIILNFADKDGKAMQHNFAALKVQKIMEKEFHGDKLPLTRDFFATDLGFAMDMALERNELSSSSSLDASRLTTASFLAILRTKIGTGAGT